MPGSPSPLEACVISPPDAAVVRVLARSRRKLLKSAPTHQSGSNIADSAQKETAPHKKVQLVTPPTRRALRRGRGAVGGVSDRIVARPALSSTRTVALCMRADGGMRSGGCARRQRLLTPSRLLVGGPSAGPSRVRPGLGRAVRCIVVVNGACSEGVGSEAARGSWRGSP